MSRTFLAALSLLAAAAAVVVLAGPVMAASAEPLTVEKLLRYQERDVGEKILEALVEKRGLVAEMTPSEVVRLREAGLSDDFIAFLVVQAVPDESSVPGVEYSREDGAVVVTGRSSPDELPPVPVRRTWEGSSRSGSSTPDLPAPIFVQAPPAQVVVQQPPSQATAPRPADHEINENPFPVGATVGLDSSVVFIPARFGEPASSFGRTVITHGDGHVGHVSPRLHHDRRDHHRVRGHHVTVHPGGHHPSAHGSANFGTHARPHVSGRSIPIRTSRGTIWVPN